MALHMDLCIGTREQSNSFLYTRGSRHKRKQKNCSRTSRRHLPRVTGPVFLKKKIRKRTDMLFIISDTKPIRHNHRKTEVPCLPAAAPLPHHISMDAPTSSIIQRVFGGPGYHLPSKIAAKGVIESRQLQPDNQSKPIRDPGSGGRRWVEQPDDKT